MIVPLPKRTQRTDDNILPLINIVFLLLIFFMLAGHMQSRPPFETAPPKTRHAADSDPAARVLSIAADGRMALGNKLIGEDRLVAELRDWDRGNALQIRADAGLPADRLTGLLSSLRRAGVAEVSLLTVHGE